MSALAAAGFAVFILILFAGIYLSLFGLPGAILVFLDVLIYALITGFSHVGWKVLLFLMFFSIFTEAVDFLFGLTHAHKVLLRTKSLFGAFVGGAAGLFIMTPILWGLGIWIGFFLGALAGLLLMEILRQFKLRGPDQASSAAFFAMAGRKTLKGCFTLVMIFVSLANIYS